MTGNLLFHHDCVVYAKFSQRPRLVGIVAASGCRPVLGRTGQGWQFVADGRKNGRAMKFCTLRLHENSGRGMITRSEEFGKVASSKYCIARATWTTPPLPCNASLISLLTVLACTWQ